jgi:hypothetical protein
MRHEFFDTVLNNKESVDYVIQIYQKLILILNYLLAQPRNSKTI